MRTELPASTLEAALTGDLMAWESLVESWLPTVIQWCRRLGGPSIDARDAAQDVFVVVFTHLDKVHSSKVFSSWIYSVTRRVLSQHRRKAWLRRWIPGSGVEGLSNDDAERSAGLSEMAAQVRAILELLPPAQREVLVLCDMEERSGSEVADLLDLPEGTVRSRLRLARARFQQEARGMAVFPGLLNSLGKGAE